MQSVVQLVIWSWSTASLATIWLVIVLGTDSKWRLELVTILLPWVPPGHHTAIHGFLGHIPAKRDCDMCQCHVKLDSGLTCPHTLSLQRLLPEAECEEAWHCMPAQVSRGQHTPCSTHCKHKCQDWLEEQRVTSMLIVKEAIYKVCSKSHSLIGGGFLQDIRAWTSRYDVARLPRVSYKAWRTTLKHRP